MIKSLPVANMRERRVYHRRARVRSSKRKGSAGDISKCDREKEVFRPEGMEAGRRDAIVETR